MSDQATLHDAYAADYDAQVSAYDCYLAEALFGLCYDFVPVSYTHLDVYKRQISTQPEGNPDLGMPGDSPLADSPMPEAPDLAPDSTEPRGAEATPDEAAPPADDVPDDTPPLPGETATDESLTEEPATDDLFTGQSAEAPLTEEPAADEPTDESAPADARPEPRRLSRGEREVVDRTRQRFAACGRCGYLIADLYLLLGEEALQVAAIAAPVSYTHLDVYKRQGVDGLPGRDAAHADRAGQRRC